MKTMDAIGSLRDCGAVPSMAMFLKRLTSGFRLLHLFFSPKKEKKTADRYNRLVSP